MCKKMSFSYTEFKKNGKDRLVIIVVKLHLGNSIVISGNLKCPMSFLTLNNFKFPQCHYVSRKGSTKLAYICIWPVEPVGRCRIVKYGPAARLKWNKKGRGAEKEPPIYIEGCLLEIRKVSPKPYCILMAASILSVEHARFINMIYV